MSDSEEVPLKKNKRLLRVKREDSISSVDDSDTVSSVSIDSKSSSKKDAKPVGKTKERSRYIRGLVEGGPDIKLSGTNDEVKLYLDHFEESSKSFMYAVLGVERHKSGLFHYHFVICYTAVVRPAVYEKILAWMYERTKSKTHNIGFANDNIKETLAYPCKDGKYTVRGECKHDLEQITANYHARNDSKAAAVEIATTVSKHLLKQREIQAYVIRFMDSRQWKLNLIIKSLYGTTQEEFDCELSKTKFTSIYGTDGLKYVAELIRNPGWRVLPVWVPDIAWIKYDDCYYNMNEGKKYELTDEKIFDIVPVHIFPCDISFDEPTNYIGSLRAQGIDIERFRRSLGRQCREANADGRFMYLWGKSDCGKTVMAKPYELVFKDILGKWCNDGAFSGSSIASCPKVVSHDTMRIDDRVNMDLNKNILIGESVPVARKHGGSVTCVGKTGIITSNANPSDMPDNYDTHAIMRRLDVFQFMKSYELCELRDKFVDIIIRETPQIIPWATKL